MFLSSSFIFFYSFPILLLHHFIMFLLLSFVLAEVPLVIPQRQIIDDMLSPSEYDKNIRPADGTTLSIGLTLNLFRLLHMDQIEETIMFSQEYLMTWKDPDLGWNRSQYSYQFEWLKAEENSLWIPDVIFSDAMTSQPLIPPEQRFVDVKYDGTVRLSAPAVVTTPCALRMEDFPYDKQICDIQIGSWMFEADVINMSISTLEIFNSHTTDISKMSSFHGNSEWELDNITAEAQIQSIFGDGNYSLIIFKVVLTRKPVYYVLVIQAPTFIIGILTIFGLFTPFSQRRERREKVTLGINMLLSISMMLNLVADMMPKAERLPLLGNYIIAEIFICSFGTIVSIVLLTIHQKAETRNWRPPKWILAIFLCNCSVKSISPSINLSHLHPMGVTPIPLETDTCKDILLLNRVKGKIRETIRLLNNHFDISSTEDNWKNEWTRIFDRLDMICLVVFQTSNIIASILFMR